MTLNPLRLYRLLREDYELRLAVLGTVVGVLILGWAWFVVLTYA